MDSLSCTLTANGCLLLLLVAVTVAVALTLAVTVAVTATVTVAVAIAITVAVSFVRAIKLSHSSTLDVGPHLLRIVFTSL